MVTVTSAPPGLAADHPGFADPVYRARRVHIAELAAAHRPGEPMPVVAYTAEEADVWRQVSAALGRLHRELACRDCLDGKERLALPGDRVPQLAEVDATLRRLTDFHLRPAGGLVDHDDFYGALADRAFCATQYVRHHSVPLYTPEPDVIHEILGHATMLATPRFADLYAAAGRAGLRTTTPAGRTVLARVFWFTLEFGVVHEEAGLRAYGAGLLSSYGEIQRFQAADIRPWSIPAMARTDFDITTYQPLLYAAPSIAAVVDELGGFFDDYDDGVGETLAQEEKA